MKIFITLVILILLVGFIALRSPKPEVRGCDGEWVEVSRSVVVDVEGSTLEYVDRVCQGKRT